MKLTEIGGSQNDGLFKAENGTVYFRKFRQGKGEIFRSCRTKDLTRARRKRDEFLAEIWGDKPIRTKRQTIGELWPIWFQGMKETKSSATAASISTGWYNLGPSIQNMFLDEITPEWWLNTYIPLKRGEENKRAGIDNSKRKFFNEWKWLSMFLKWAEENGKSSPGQKRAKLLNPDPPTDEGRVFSPEEIMALLDHSSLRMRTFIKCGIEHFMRRSEIRLLEWDRVDLKRCQIKLRAQDTKIRKPRTFPINSELVDLLKRVRAENVANGFDSKFVFPARQGGPSDMACTMTEFRNMWEGTYEKAGLPKGTRFHWTRHTGLTAAFKKPGSNVAMICLCAGLSLKEAMETYLHVDIEDLRSIIEVGGEPSEGRGKFGESVK